MKSKNFWENFIITAIILVIVQTFLDEFSRYMHWSVDARNMLLVAGFCFDLIFSIEFTVRSILASKRGVTKYWFYERGWIDFLSSFPLLLLNSGPALYLLYFSHMHEGAAAVGILNVLKVVKAIRVTRILRLVRIIKIFGKIQNASSAMAQHHTSAISTTAVFSIICVLVTVSIVTTDPAVEIMKKRSEHYKAASAQMLYFEKQSELSYEETAKKMFGNDPNILKINYNNKKLISNITDQDFNKYYDEEDFTVLNTDKFAFYISNIDINRQIAYEHMVNFFMIVCVVLAFMIVYTRHFAQNISDLIHVMDKGFRKKEYNLQVKIRDEFADQEIYKLAKFYNDAYLPAKEKRMKQQSEKKSADISLDYLKSFNK